MLIIHCVYEAAMYFDLLQSSRIMAWKAVKAFKSAVEMGEPFSSAL